MEEISTPQSGGGFRFRSRRSYPSLHHVSLTPLTNRFPIDDDDDDDDGAPQDYFSPRAERSADTPTRTSYLSSFSVPGTPGVLSHSRSTSRLRHHSRSKSSSRIHWSDSSLHAQGESQPLHHHHHHNHHHNHNANGTKKARTPTSHHDSPHRDVEWILRAGIALASSTREEKGQSWLVKRESSTNLVSESTYDAAPAAAHSGSRSSRSRSGRSTPAAYSRRGSRSRAASRRNSRPDLAMTSLGAMSPRLRLGAGAGAVAGRDDVRLLPDFVDERIRAEMASIQQIEDGYAYASGSEGEFGSDESDGSDDDEEEIDEQELQRLTRERGFGLGGWIDRMVEWSLFGVEDLPLAGRGGDGPAGQTEKASEVSLRDECIGDHHSVSGLTDDNDNDGLSADESVISTVVEKPGENGGWEDAGWLIRAMKWALL